MDKVEVAFVMAILGLIIMITTELLLAIPSFTQLMSYPIGVAMIIIGFTGMELLDRRDKT